MEIEVQGGSTLQLDKSLFGREYNESLVYQVLTAYMAGGRSGTRAQKSRADVRGSGAKPWRQKGTGRARVGTAQNPIWRGGGVTFAARPKNWAQKVNRKMYHSAIANILSELIRSERLVVVDKIEVAEPKTKLVVELLEELGANGGRTLLVVNELSENLYLGARNIPNLAVLDPKAIDPVSLVSSDKVIVTAEALKSVEEWLA